MPSRVRTALRRARTGHEQEQPGVTHLPPMMCAATMQAQPLPERAGATGTTAHRTRLLIEAVLME